MTPRGFADETTAAMAAFIVDACLGALPDAATAHRPQWLAPASFRREVAALLDRYLAGGKMKH